MLTAGTYVERAAEAEPASKERKQAMNVLASRHRDLERITGNDLAGQVHYSVQRSDEVLDAVRDVMQDICEQRGNSGGGVFEPLSTIEALFLQEKTGLGQEAYAMLRALLPRNQIPNCKPVRQQKIALVPGVVEIPGCKDGVILTNILGNVCERAEQKLTVQNSNKQ